MVSRRNFVSILIMMVVVLFMFQVSEVIKENQSDYDVNTYAGEAHLNGTNAWEQKDGVYEEGDFVVYFGNIDSSIGHIVEQWCVYTKRNLLAYTAFEDYQIASDCIPEAVLVDSDVADPVEGFSFLEEITGYGTTLIFCNLPGPARLRENRKLLNLLGIQSIREEEIETEGIRIVGDLFLGGEAFYVVDDGDEEEQKRQDLELDVPWYIMKGETKTYMVAVLDELLGDVEARNELFPSLIWRSFYQGSRVFAVVGDYMERIEGIGILDGMMYEASSYSLYPVVNAQNVVVGNFPVLAEENGERIMELYSQNTEALLRDICWPTLSTLERRSHYKLTCLIATQFDYTDGVEPSENEIPFYLQQFKEFTSEAGISLDRVDATDLSEKLVRDRSFYDELNDSYIYSSFFVQEKDLDQVSEALSGSSLFAGIRTVASEYQENDAVVSYYSPDVTRQNITADAAFYNYSDDLRMRSLETALGYSNVLLDMHPVVWPEAEEDQWEKFSKRVMSNLNTYWKSFTVFDRTTLSESDERIRAFLNLDYRQRRVEDTIYLEVSGSDKSCFILRTHGEKIVGIEGGTYVEIEEDAYMIYAEGQEVEIQLEKSRGRLKYTLD